MTTRETHDGTARVQARTPRLDWVTLVSAASEAMVRLDHTPGA